MYIYVHHGVRPRTNTPFFNLKFDTHSYDHGPTAFLFSSVNLFNAVLGKIAITLPKQFARQRCARCLGMMPLIGL